MNNTEWRDAFFENYIIKDQLDYNFFCLNDYKAYVDKRYKLFQIIKDDQDDKYKEEFCYYYLYMKMN